MSEPVFVFGSNLAGRHGKGAALFARQQRGAVYGQAFGMQGNSFAIPTKDRRFRTLPLDEIHLSVTAFVLYATAHPEMTFYVTPIGCGLAGYKPEHIAPMFVGSPDNVELPPEFVSPAKEGSRQP